MDVRKELDENQTLLLLMPGIEYSEIVIDMVKQLSSESLCYVTLNKTCKSLRELFKKNGVNTDNIAFIDGISNTFMEVCSQTDGCYFVSSPSALTELSVTISRIMKHGFKHMIFDSLTSLTVYEKKASVARFMSTVANRVRSSNTKAVFYALKMKEQGEFITECEMYVDKVIELDESGKH